MKTTFLTLMAATLAVTTLTGCKKDSGDDDDNVIRFTDPNLTVAVGKTAQVKLFVPSGSGIADIKSNNTQVAIAEKTTNYLLLNIIGVKEGNTTVEVKNGNRTQKAVLNVHVFKENIAKNGGFEVDNSIIFLKKGQDTDITGRFKKGSGNFKVTTPSTAVARVRQEGHRWIATGWGEGLTGDLTFIDMVGTKTITVPVYVIKPFKTKNEVPTTVVQGWESTIYFDGIYIASTTENNNFDRMKVTATGVVTAEIKREYKNFSHPELGNVAKSITIKANSIGTGNVRIDNGDGQFINLPFSVRALTVGDYYNIDSDGVLLSLKPGVTLPSDVILPPNVKKVAEKVFKNHPEIKTINFNNVTEIEGNLFDNMATGGTGLNVISVEMPKVVKVGYDAFRNAKHLKKIKFPASLKFLGNGALLGCESLDDVAFEGTEPPKLLAYNGDVELTKKLDGVFSFDARNTKTLYVSIGRLSEYQKKIDIQAKFRKGVKDISEFK